MAPVRVVDLSFPLKPHFRWTVKSERRSSHEAGNLFQSTIFTSSCHAYTHVDAPVHFLPGDRDIAQMPVDQWMGPAAVVDLTHLGENGEVTAGDLERLGGHVQAGDIVLLRTDWPRKCPVESERFWREAPYTGRSACDWLVARKVKAVGYDYPPDYAVRTTIFEPGKKVTRYECTTHDVFFPAGITVIEYLTPRSRHLAGSARERGGRRRRVPGRSRSTRASPRDSARRRRRSAGGSDSRGADSRDRRPRPRGGCASRAGADRAWARRPAAPPCRDAGAWRRAPPWAPAPRCAPRTSR